MTMEEAAVKIEGHEHEIKSLKHRMDDVERDQQALIKLTASVEVMATKQEISIHVPHAGRDRR